MAGAMFSRLCVSAVVVASPVQSASFDDWLVELRTEAREQGISQNTLDGALAGLQPLPRVLILQRRQPESTLSYSDYLRRVVPDARVRQGRQAMVEHSAVLEQVAARYGLQPRFIVALWGIESDFGQGTGNTPTVPALATLAHGGRRQSYFRRELIAALKILDRRGMDGNQLRGSWAGALGQCQFMPSNYLRLAVDFDADGDPDIWNSEPDVFASIAHYLSREGWRDDETWGRPVLLPAGFDARLAGSAVRVKLERWQRLGVRRLNEGDLPTRDLWASLMIPDGLSGRAFLVYDDFQKLLRWNRSIHFALAVGELSDRLQ
ncbi:MAG: lytic murein transglycosylase [Candidatus Latescibacterota bacterium]|nr:lytic murein transglycosylase [Candidatus Latescibacterota bacterium]